MTQEQRSRKYVLILIALHIVVMMLLFVVVLARGGDYYEILLHDDGYYHTAGHIVRGESRHSMYGLGYPLILTVLYVFPTILHPFLRLLISIAITGCTVLLVFRIFSHYLLDREIFFGGLLFVLNPLYIHWMLKSRVEAPLVLLLGVIILFTQRYQSTGQVRYVIYVVIALAFGIFTKPVFIMIPFFLILLGFCIRSRRLSVIGVTFGIIAILSFLGTKYVIDRSACRMEYYKIHSIVGSSFYVDAIVRNGDFKTQYMYVSDSGGNVVRNPRLIPGDEWMLNYRKRFGNQNPIMMSLRLAYEKPCLIIQQIFFNIFLAFSLSSTELETFFHFFVNFPLFILAVFGIIKVKNNRGDLYIQLAAVVSVYILLIFVHSRSPYFIPIIPYLFVFGGKPLTNIVSKKI